MIDKGFIKPKIELNHYYLGASPLVKTVLQPNHSWLEFLPEFEPQSKQLETSNCTSFNTLNCIEILLRRLSAFDDNYSDRFLGIMAGTYPPGNDPHVVCEVVRHTGLIEEPLLSFTDEIQTVDEYYSFKGGNEPLCKAKGLEWVETWKFGHEWVKPNKESMMEALKYSPLGVAVVAWQKNKYYYKRPEQDDNHWTAIVDYKENEYWIVYDSYMYDGSAIKYLEWDYPFEYIKRFSLSVQPETIETLNWIEQILLALKKLVENFKSYGWEIIK